MASFGKLKTKQLEWTANMTDLNHLARLHYAKPEMFQDTMNQLFSARNYYADNALTSMLFGTAAEKTVNSLEHEWNMKGADVTPLIIMENILPVANTTPGLRRRPFDIKVDKNWYLPGDVLSFGGNKKHQVRIQSQPRIHGDGFAYTVRLNNDDPAAFLPIAYLRSGQKVTKLFSTYEEANEQRGSTQFSGTTAMRNRLSKFAKQYRITDYASIEVLATKIRDSQGGTHDMWMRYADVEYWMQWYRELEAGAWYSRSTNSVIGGNGRPVVQGAGIQEQLEDSHQEGYNVLTADFIEEYLMDIFYSRTAPGKGRKIVGYTGEYGMLQFHRAIQDKVNKSGFVQNFEQFSSKTSSPLHDNAQSFGYQYTEYKMANGSSLTLMHNPLYDDRSINHEIDEASGFPKESQRISFLDFSGDAGESNVQLLKKKDAYAFGYVEGLYGPYGPSQGGRMAHGGSYYEMHVEQTMGVNLIDPTKCGELIKQ